LKLFIETRNESDWLDVAIIWYAEALEKRTVEHTILIPIYESVLIERPYSLYAAQCREKIRDLRGDFR
jgi:hypothetical protein